MTGEGLEVYLNDGVDGYITFIIRQGLFLSSLPNLPVRFWSSFIVIVSHVYVGLSLQSSIR